MNEIKAYKKNLKFPIKVSKSKKCCWNPKMWLTGGYFYLVVKFLLNGAFFSWWNRARVRGEVSYPVAGRIWMVNGTSFIFKTKPLLYFRKQRWQTNSWSVKIFSKFAFRRKLRAKKRVRGSGGGGQGGEKK